MEREADDVVYSENASLEETDSEFNNQIDESLINEDTIEKSDDSDSFSDQQLKTITMNY